MVGRAVGGCLRVGGGGAGGTVKNTLKERETENRGGETKILKRGGKLGQWVGALKKGGLEPLYELWVRVDDLYQGVSGTQGGFSLIFLLFLCFSFLMS